MSRRDATELKLKFSKANNKNVGLEEQLGGRVYSFSLLAGHSCPGASFCLARVFRDDDGGRKLVRGPKAVITCFSASQELQYPSVYEARMHNFSAIMALRGSREAMRDALLEGISELPEDLLRAVRIHISGDFFSWLYLLAWVDVAVTRDDLRFYGYTKSVHHLLRVDEGYEIPDNFSVVISEGGRFDSLIPEARRRGFYTADVLTPEQCDALIDGTYVGRPVDHDDSHACFPTCDFSLLPHGPQEKGSPYGRAIARLRQQMGFSGYGRKKTRRAA